MGLRIAIRAAAAKDRGSQEDLVILTLNAVKGKEFYYPSPKDLFAEFTLSRANVLRVTEKR